MKKYTSTYGKKKTKFKTSPLGLMAEETTSSVAVPAIATKQVQPLAQPVGDEEIIPFNLYDVDESIDETESDFYPEYDYSVDYSSSENAFLEMNFELQDSFNASNEVSDSIKSEMEAPIMTMVQSGSKLTSSELAQTKAPAQVPVEPDKKKLIKLGAVALGIYFLTR